MTNFEAPRPAEAVQPELTDQQAKIERAFEKEAEFRAALSEYIAAQEVAEFDAPDGFLISVTATEDGGLTEVWDAHKPDMTSFHPVKAGSIRYATGLRYSSYGGRGVLRLHRGKSSTYANVYHDFPYVYIVSNVNFELGLISVDEYRQRRESGDKTLFHGQELVQLSDVAAQSAQ